VGSKGSSGDESSVGPACRDEAMPWFHHGWNTGVQSGSATADWASAP
jgi:hypothetical protein